MSEHIFKINTKFVIIILLILVSSCKSSSKLIKDNQDLYNSKYFKLSSINKNKLLTNIEDNSFVYNSLFIKRMDISFFENEKNTRLKGYMMIQRDSFIQISLTAPLGLEVARILLTPDSVKFVNSYNKKYFIGDYDYINNKYSLPLDYKSIQNILTNNMFVMSDSKLKYSIKENENYYQLTSIYNLHLNSDIKQLNNNKSILKLLHSNLVDKEKFKLYSTNIADVDGNMNLKLNYDNFVEIDKFVNPYKLLFTLEFKDYKIKFNLNYDRVEYNVPIKSNFRIPSKYKKISI